MATSEQHPSNQSGDVTQLHMVGQLCTAMDLRLGGGVADPLTRTLLRWATEAARSPVRDAVIDAMKTCRSIYAGHSRDQGSEMALHVEIAQALGMPVYFCEKASPWQRPIVRVRQRTIVGRDAAEPAGV